MSGSINIAPPPNTSRERTTSHWRNTASYFPEFRDLNRPHRTFIALPRRDTGNIGHLGFDEPSKLRTEFFARERRFVQYDIFPEIRQRALE